MLVVCGESFSYGTSEKTWPAILAKKLDLELINLSIVGCSNVAICHQLQYVINSETIFPSLVVTSLTAAERFEIDENDQAAPALLRDFRSNIDEIEEPLFNNKPSITSGNVASQLRNINVEMLKPYLMSSSYRLSAQNQAWAINYLMGQFRCKKLLYRNIFPRYHKDKSKYNNEHMFGLRKVINSGPYDYELSMTKTTNHLSDEENQQFADRVFADIDIYNP